VSAIGVVAGGAPAARRQPAPLVTLACLGALLLLLVLAASASGAVAIPMARIPCAAVVRTCWRR
jgi:hypothetical protein